MITAATPADADAIWALLEPVFRAGETYAVDPGIDRAAALSLWTAAPACAFLARAGDGRVLGTCYVKPNGGGPMGHVANAGFVTGAAAQGRGTARAMLDHVLDTARAAGYRAMQFNAVFATNHRALRLWRSAGFEIVGRLPGAVLHPTEGVSDALVMYRTL